MRVRENLGEGGENEIFESNVVDVQEERQRKLPVKATKRMRQSELKEKREPQVEIERLVRPSK